MANAETRVQVHAQIHEFVAAQLKIPGKIFYTRPEIMVPAMLEIQTQYGLDVPSITYDAYNIEAEALGQRLIFTDANMADVDRSAPLIRERADLAKIKAPDFDSAGRFARIIEIHTLYKKLTGREPTLRFCAPFSLVANLRGIEQCLLDIQGNPDFARELFRQVTEQVLAPWILYQKRYFPDAARISGADATASIPIVNLRILRDWAAPHILRLREMCGPQVSVVNWVGEKYLQQPEDMLNLKLKISHGLIQGQDPDVEALGAELYKDYANRNNAALSLGVGAAFLANSTPDEIARRVQYYCQVGRQAGRFSLYLCNVGRTTAPENLRAAIDAAHAS